ncbi:hypothetical protein TEA_009012 [Camellia sinensis var. sinensis]|uniref:Pentatricopeptide repeat-containing protein n=1 Tax=Camellia sinensis var. sinensis TaxID=542762 RepID=A0A4S4DT20_CAMSN|nr:hypothetical protein TEA_009012 [Camellia sinensis var. sinensis]
MLHRYCCRRRSSSTVVVATFLIRIYRNHQKKKTKKREEEFWICGDGERGVDGNAEIIDLLTLSHCLSASRVLYLALDISPSSSSSSNPATPRFNLHQALELTNSNLTQISLHRKSCRNETMELMVSLMCAWLKKLIKSKHDVVDVVDLLLDMNCVGLKPNFSMIEKVISLYWDMGKNERTVLFVKEVLRREIAYREDGMEGHKGGPTGYLAWKMMTQPSLERARADRQLRKQFCILLWGRCPSIPPGRCLGLAKGRCPLDPCELTGKLDPRHSQRSGNLESINITNFYVRDLLLRNGYDNRGERAERIGKSLVQLKRRRLIALQMVHERLLAMYICAGRGLEAERQLWGMKLVGKEADGDLYDIVLAICASQKEAGSIAQLMSRMGVGNFVAGTKKNDLTVRTFEDLSQAMQVPF